MTSPEATADLAGEQEAKQDVVVPACDAEKKKMVIWDAGDEIRGTVEKHEYWRHH